VGLFRDFLPSSQICNSHFQSALAAFEAVAFSFDPGNQPNFSEAIGTKSGLGSSFLI
jgi:hypothetical protein